MNQLYEATIGCSLVPFCFHVNCYAMADCFNFVIVALTTVLSVLRITLLY